MDKIKAYIERGREIEAEATPGVWSAGMYLGGAGEIYQTKPNGDRIRHVADCFVTTMDAKFIAHARNHHARLLDALEEALRQRSERVHFQDQLPDEIERMEAEQDARIAAILEGK